MSTILVRHFPSPLNEKKVSRGWLSVGVDKEAAAPMAKEVAKILADRGIKKLVSSDLPRGSQSMKMIADEMPYDVQTSSTRALRTWNTGDMSGEKESKTIPLRQKLIKYSDEKPPGGETFNTFMDRFEPELRKLEGQPDTAFIAHGHHLLAAPHILAQKDVDPAKLPSLDEDYPPGSAYALSSKGAVERLDKEKTK